MRVDWHEGFAKALELCWPGLEIARPRGVSLRVYLTGRLTVEAADRQLDQGDFPARQECLAFAYLTLERQHGVAREALAAILWPKRLPRAWETSLNAVI